MRTEGRDYEFIRGSGQRKKKHHWRFLKGKNTGQIDSPIQEDFVGSEK